MDDTGSIYTTLSFTDMELEQRKHPLPDLMHHPKYQQAMEQIAAHIENILCEILWTLGHESIAEMLDILETRSRRVVYPDQSGEIIYIDDIPVLYLPPMFFQHFRASNIYTMDIEQPYEVLIDDEED